MQIIVEFIDKEKAITVCKFNYEVSDIWYNEATKELDKAIKQQEANYTNRGLIGKFNKDDIRFIYHTGIDKFDLTIGCHCTVYEGNEKLQDFIYNLVKFKLPESVKADIVEVATVRFVGLLHNKELEIIKI